MPTHYKGNRTNQRALNAYVTLARASETIFARLGRDLASRGLTLGQFGVLEVLLHLGPRCQKELGDKLLRSGGNVTLVINNLERQGWVRRGRLAGDRRKFRIELTPGGRRLIERVFPLHVKEIAKEFGRLDPAEQEALRRLCRKLGRGGNGRKQQGRREENEDDTSSAK